MAKHFIRGKYRDEDRIIGPSLDAIENAYDILLALPDSDSASFISMDSHRKSSEEGDLNKVWMNVFVDNYNWLKFFWWSSALKTRQLTASLIELYNSDSYLPWLILARSTLEYAAVSYHFVRKIDRNRLMGPHFRAGDLMAFEDVMKQYAHGSRFNWKRLLAGDLTNLQSDLFPEQSKAVNVLTALNTLSKRDERYKDLCIAYEMLSDFAHPNMASHTSICEMPTAPLGSQVRMHVRPGQLRGEFLMIISLPWVSTGVGTVVELFSELTPLVRTWLSYLEGGPKITIDLRQ
jgi:hypothetical protein